MRPAFATLIEEDNLTRENPGGGVVVTWTRREAIFVFAPTNVLRLARFPGTISRRINGQDPGHRTKGKHGTFGDTRTSEPRRPNSIWYVIIPFIPIISFDIRMLRKS